MRKRFIDPTEQHTVYDSLREFLDADTYPRGVLTVMHRGIPIDVRHDPAGHDTTTIFFHAALSKAAARFPIFAGGLMSEGLPTNRIHISDPTLLLDEKLGLGWYAGNAQQPKLQSTIRFILRALVPEGQHVVTFGASGGGFAALYYATRFEGGIAVPVNPQTNIAQYLPESVDRYTQLAWKIPGRRKIAEVPARTNLVTMYMAPVANRVFYIQNTGDLSHVKKQMTPFLRNLAPENEVHKVMVDAGPGHKAPPTAFMRGVLASAIRGDARPTY